MKTKTLALLLLALMAITALSGCSKSESFKVELTKNNEVIVSATDDCVARLKEVKSTDSSLLFKNIKISHNKGLFYNSYTVNMTTNAFATTDIFELKVTMPGEIAQIKGGEIKENTVNFEISDLKQENDFAAYSESNNIGVVIVIICILAVIAVGFFFIMKRKQV